MTPEQMAEQLKRLEWQAEKALTGWNEALSGVTVAQDETGWYSAETPIGRIGLYATLPALFGAILYAYQQRIDAAHAAGRAEGRAELEPWAEHSLECGRNMLHDRPCSCGLAAVLDK